MFDINQLKFDEQGLIPAVVQDFHTGEVLTVAYMNRESLQISLEQKKTCFFSRSRQQLWLKGETSGHYQHIRSITADCDGDALVVRVTKDGPACHTGSNSCFFNPIYHEEQQTPFSIDELYHLIEGRKQTLPEGSYTTYLFQKGLDKILKKVGEEATEVIIGAKNGKEEATFELADLTYHALVLMAELGISLSELRDELGRRHVIDHKVKQEPLQ
ncbi:MAG: bifunctional phosphoribosyl-AMP cyclohydrolase/phosphoribosyl-ATP diphosphatase HisIE [Eubacteriales bacterium]